MAKKLLEILSDKIRFKHYSIRTEQVYIHWVKWYILFHHKKDAKEMGKVEIAQFLTYLAVIRKISPVTHTTKSWFIKSSI